MYFTATCLLTLYSDIQENGVPLFLIAYMSLYLLDCRGKRRAQFSVQLESWACFIIQLAPLNYTQSLVINVNSLSFLSFPSPTSPLMGTMQVCRKEWGLHTAWQRRLRVPGTSGLRDVPCLRDQVAAYPNSICHWHLHGLISFQPSPRCRSQL